MIYDVIDTEDTEHTILSLSTIADIHKAAALSEPQVARLFELGCLLPCEPQYLAGAPVELFDRDNRTIVVPAFYGDWTVVALGDHAFSAVERTIGSRRYGPLAPGPDGNRMFFDPEVEMDANEILVEEHGIPPWGEWFLSDVRASIIHYLQLAGVSEGVLKAQTALIAGAHVGEDGRSLLSAQKESAQLWEAMLGLTADHPLLAFEGRGHAGTHNAAHNAGWDHFRIAQVRRELGKRK